MRKAQDMEAFATHYQKKGVIKLLTCYCNTHSGSLMLSF